MSGELKKAKRFFGEFKTFAIRGNMLDMAVGIIVGGAFTTLVTSIIGNIAMPMIGLLIGVDFSAWEIELPRLYGSAEPSVLGIGAFLNNLISFVAVALTVFLLIKFINKLRKKHDETPPPAPPEPSKEELLLTEIRDLLKQRTDEI
ncbi:MAG: large-conductance mechanosensitive channel protein MscL [Oscillospiraceae bacterium]|nr:large-conductance mechanosensitive channel protein MscL [Oscillospiraceae bacterium]